jgi:hypothetical protein
VDESDLLSLRVRSKDPRDFFHFAEGGVSSVDVARARGDRETDEVVVAGQLTALDDFVSEALPLHDGGVLAAETKRRLTVLDGASTDLQAHGQGLLQAARIIDTSLLTSVY